jgi:hypothetical protein
MHMISARRPAAQRQGLGHVVRLLCATRDPGEVATALREAVAAHEPARLLAGVEHHRLGPCLYLGLKGQMADLDNVLAEGLSRRYRVQAAHHVRTMADLGQCAASLDVAGVAWATFKGPALAESVYLRPDMRAYGDLDIVVSPADVETTISALVPNDAAVSIGLAHAAQSVGVDQVSLVLPFGTSLDLHWSLLSLDWARRDFPMPLDDFLESRVSVTAGGFAMKTFDPEHTLVHLCAHAGLSGGHRGLWLKDIAETIRVHAIDWDLVVRLSESMNLSLMCAVMLSRVREIAGVTGPPGVIERLGGRSAWARAVRISDRLRRPEEGTGRGASGQLLARSTRATTARSIRTFTAGERRSLGRRLRRRPAPSGW